MTSVASRVEPAAGNGERASLPFELLTEIALGALTISAVVSLSRLFADTSFLAPLVLIAVVGHVTAALLRRRGFTSVSTVAIAVAGGVVLAIWVLYPGTTFLGLPTGDSLSTARGDLSKAWDLFARVAAPAPAATGFVLASAIAIWVAVWFSDWAAFRLDAVVEATVPASAVFVFGALLGAERQRTSSTLVFVAALFSFLLLHRIQRQARGATWIADGAVAGGRSSLVNGLAVVAVAILVAGVVGPRLPGSDSKAVFDWRNGSNGPGTRITVSPLVDIRKRLVDQSDVEVFRVRSNARAFWRLTSLDSFDGTVWSSSGSFATVHDELPAEAPGPVVSTLRQDFRIVDLSAIWLPAAYKPSSVETDGTGVRWDEESSTLIVDTKFDSSDNITYRVVSAVPQVTRADLVKGLGSVSLAIASRYESLPKSFPKPVTALAESITRPATNPYQTARLLQDYFRKNFRYSLSTKPGQSDNAITSFLASKTGYCEQFAGTYAAMARSVGLPARVAVGFTPGEPDPDSVDRYIVKGKHAHAWPEVYFSGVGWVPFEPTPERGAPGARDYTGVAEAQAGGVADRSSSTTTTSTSVPFPSAPTPSTNPASRLDTAGLTGTGGGRGPSGPARFVRIVTLVLLAVGAWVGTLALARLLRQARRRRKARTPADQVRVSWQEGTEAAASMAPALERWETHDEFANRAGAQLGEAGIPLVRLARVASVATWAPEGADAESAAEARRLSTEVRRRVRLALEPRQKLRKALDPRLLLHP